MRTRDVGVWGGCIDPRGLSGTRHYYTMPNGKVKRPANFFPIFFGGAAGRQDGLAVGLGPCGRRQRKAPVIGWTAKLADSGGEIAPSSWVTNPRARTFAPWRCVAHT